MKFENSEYAQIDFTKEVPYISFPILSNLSFIRHGFSTRLGGVSEGVFSSMNLGYDTGPYADNTTKIWENYQRISKSIGINVHSIVISKQVHKTNIRFVDESDCGKGLDREQDFEEIDGLITNRPNVTLVTKYADCVPLYFIDPEKRAIGLTHSGWRGTVKKIGKITVGEMQKQFGSDPAQMIAVIGPSICKDCYEVGEEVAMEFWNAFSTNGKDNNIITSKRNGKYQCDLWKANHHVLTEAGIKSENINVSGLCTCCHSDLLFSHRKTGEKRGSLAAFLAIHQE